MKCRACQGAGHHNSNKCFQCKGAGWLCGKCKKPIWATLELEHGLCYKCLQEDIDEDEPDQFGRHPDEGVNAGRRIYGD